LLSAALNPEADEVHRKYVTILADLTSQDATVLLAIWKEWQEEKRDTFQATATVSYGPGVRGKATAPPPSSLCRPTNGLFCFQPAFSRLVLRVGSAPLTKTLLHIEAGERIVHRLDGADVIEDTVQTAPGASHRPFRITAFHQTVTNAQGRRKHPLLQIFRLI